MLRTNTTKTRKAPTTTMATATMASDGGRAAGEMQQQKHQKRAECRRRRRAKAKNLAGKRDRHATLALVASTSAVGCRRYVSRRRRTFTSPRAQNEHDARSLNSPPTIRNRRRRRRRRNRCVCGADASRRRVDRFTRSRARACVSSPRLKFKLSAARALIEVVGVGDARALRGRFECERTSERAGARARKQDVNANGDQHAPSVRPPAPSARLLAVALPRSLFSQPLIAAFVRCSAESATLSGAPARA